MKHNEFSKKAVRAMYVQALAGIAIAEAALNDKARIEAGANISGLCGYEVKARWQALLRHYEDEMLLALALLADVE